MMTSPNETTTRLAENDPPTVSAIIATTGDRPEDLRRAIRSMLDQEPFSPDEIVVVYDRVAPDGSLPLEFPDHDVKVIANTRTPGLPGGRNSGVQVARGEWVAFCDDDDFWTPDRLASQVELIGDDVDFIVGGIEITYGDRTVVRTPGTDTVTFDMLLRDRIVGAHSSTFLMRRAAIEGRLGWDDEEIPGRGYNEDYDWMLRAARHSPIRAVDRPLAVVAWHPQSYYRNRWQAAIDATEALIDKTPEFHTTRVGLARLTGHMAFAHAGLGDRRSALRLVWKTFRLNPLQLRSYITLAVVLGVVRPDWLVAKANAFGRGI